MMLIGDIFPFDSVEQTEFIDLMNSLYALNDFSLPLTSIDNLNTMLYDQFNVNSCNRYDGDFDPNISLQAVSDKIKECSYYYLDTLSQKFHQLSKSDTNYFSICSFNINSLPANFESFSLMLTEISFKFDIIGICESKLIKDIESLYNIPNYTRVTNCNTRKSGGLALFINNKYFNVKIRNDLNKMLLHFESLFVEINVNGKNILVGVIYRRPGTRVDDFVAELDDVMSLVKRGNLPVYLSGDFNINLLNYDNCQHTQTFVNLMHSYGLYNVIN